MKYIYFVVLKEQGFIYFKNYLPHELVYNARDVILESLSKEWKVLDESSNDILNPLKAPIKKNQKGLILTFWKMYTVQ